MLKLSLALAALALAGCADMFGSNNSARMATVAPTGAELAAYAAAHPYPTTMPTNEHFRAAAIVDRANGTIKIYNFDTKPIADATVWVNRSFVQHLNGIAPNSSAVVLINQLYNGMGKSLSSLNEPITIVQLEMNGTLYTLQGPAAD